MTREKDIVSSATRYLLAPPARGETEKACTGRYRVVGDDVHHVDDTGFTADGQLRGDVLHHGGMVVRRR